MINSRRKSASRVSLGIALVLLLAASASSAPKRQFKSDTDAADSFQKKVDFIRTNAGREPPDQKPTVFSEEEINSYFVERRLKMPEGVQKVSFALAKDQVTASTRVDFERLRQGHTSMNPLLAIFDGIHDCQVIATTGPAGPGMVHVRVDSLVIDGMTVPRTAMELFVKHYVNPKYPDVGLDNDYRLPARIDSAAITQETGTIIQK